jgi:GntR family transcriptional regulator / MocR family aminotransferase
MFLPLVIDPQQPLQRQIYDGLVALIDSGVLPAGTRMPSTRSLAVQLAVSRITVLLAYDRLTGEGRIQTLPAVGTFVCAHGEQAATAAPHAEAAGVAEIELDRFPVDPDLFPAGRWRGLLRRALDGVTPHPVAQGSAIRPLRRAVAGWLATTRRIDVSPERVFILDSHAIAVDFATRLVCPDARVVVEPSCPAAIAGLWSNAGARLFRAPADAGEIDAANLPAAAALLHLAQNPQQVPCDPSRADRLSGLLGWAESAGAMILEDDPICDLRADPAASSAVLTGERQGRVMHLGGFAATMSPWVQLAYLVVPDSLLERAQALAWHTEDSAPRLERVALAELIESGFYARHVLRLRRAHQERRIALENALAEHFPKGSVLGAGCFALAWVPPASLGQPDDIAAALSHAGATAEALELPAWPNVPVVRIEFASRDTPVLTRAVARLRGTSSARLHAVAETVAMRW